ncbi:unnamed protein product [Strongylus vulgaris]|uniref:BZIP domain-containing protein n=1 Tax=Strongylus vulgaris TaxID=40348 RepID=A0A3P7IKU4_STRVU|nr:unnamed protein product [Strongylus vulgaris]
MSQEELADLLADVSKEGGQLDQLACGGVCPPSELEPLPLVNNVSLSEGIVFTPQNVTEMSLMQEQRQAALASVMAPPAPATLYNETTMPSMWVQQAEITPNDIYPNNGYMTFQNDTGTQVISTGSQYDHQYLGNIPSDQCDEVRLPREARKFTNKFVRCFRTLPLEHCLHMIRTMRRGPLLSASGLKRNISVNPHRCALLHRRRPRPITIVKLKITVLMRAGGFRVRLRLIFRYFGKLAPREIEEPSMYPRTVCGSNGDNSVSPTLANMPRRRGRQSKDEQLAAANRLPLSAREISEMTLGELHKVLKNEDLTEQQKQLIRKIRRRGKNKVAARTCRERRGERQRNMRENESWTVPVRIF